MQQVMQTLESVTYYRMRLVKSLYDKLGTLAAPSIASFTACDKPRNLSAQCVCPETAGYMVGLVEEIQDLQPFQLCTNHQIPIVEYLL